MDTKKTIKAHVLRDFKDAGTERSFTAGDRPDLEVGAFRNYRAAGLVAKHEPEAEPKSPANGKAKA